MSSDPNLRCSVVAQELNEPPLGTAGGAERYLLIELPLPWPKKIDEHELLADVRLASLPKGSVSILGIRSTDVSRVRSHRVICYERRRPFTGFDRSELVLDSDQLAPTVQSLIEAGPATLANDQLLSVEAGTEDLLLCTHGSRDRCCGQLGTNLHVELEQSVPSNVRLWRASHLGGHRFAPTGLHFPTGTVWAHLTAEVTKAIISRSVEPASISSKFRGNVGIDGRPEQIADGLAFFGVGWDWLAAERTIKAVDGQPGEVEVSVASPEFETRIIMETTDPIPVPKCGEGTETATKFTPQHVVIDTAQLTPPD